MKTAQSKQTVLLAQGAMIAALYTVLTLLAAAVNLAYGPVQFRFSEALTLLPVFTPAAIPGLAIGCLLSNLFSGYGVADLVFGTLATLLAALLTRMVRNVRVWNLPILAPLPPVLCNAVIVGAMLAAVNPGGFTFPVFWSMALSVGAGELAVCYPLGLLLVVLTERSGLHRLLERPTLG